MRNYRMDSIFDNSDRGLFVGCYSRSPSSVVLNLVAFGIPIIYYISPQLWAWRTGRIKIVQKFIDKMLVLFPFEVDFYKNHNVDCEFVGHPLLDELDPEKYSETARNELRSRYGFKSSEKVLGLMPGSRPSELKLNLESQLKAAEILYKKDPSLKIYLAVAPSFDISELQVCS